MCVAKEGGGVVCRKGEELDDSAMLGSGFLNWILVIVRSLKLCAVVAGTLVDFLEYLGDHFIRQPLTVFTWPNQEEPRLVS